jgi:ribonuclease-3
MNKIEYLNSDSESSNNNSVSSVVEKKIFPVYNENNFYISKEIIHMILRSVNITHTINNIEIWQKAFIHKSYCDNTDFRKNEKFFGSIDMIDINKEENNKRYIPLQQDSNEVLEWLGDGIIQSVVAIYLFKRYKDQREGFLTKIRSKLVKTETLSKLALHLNFDKFLILSKHIEVICNGRKNARILEDCFEAFIGAMMTDLGSKNETDGFSICNTFIINLIESKIDITELILNDDNYKDQLMRYYQKEFNGKFPKYEQKTIIMSTNDNGIVNRKFHMFVRDTNNNIIGEGIAKSKKEAEQKAAKAALMYFGISNGF